ncbi:MAG: leucine-rich repeat domain-containing protein [Spirochaetaceae bacterium]|jgi:hypothetical protein|nr:leucine-rich repeat domain-containing protein [Spirochaetaceae bacterium]
MMKKAGFSALFLGFCFMLFGQEVITDFAADKGSPIVQKGDFLVQGSVLVKYIGAGGAVVIPTDLEITEIGPNAFGNTSVQSAVIPQGVAKIAGYAFTNCPQLTAVTIPDSVTDMGDGAFSKCAQLRSVNIPLGVAAIGESIFSDCTALSNITVDSYNRFYTAIDGVLFTYDRTVLITYPAGKTDAQYAVPKGVTEIKQNAFSSNVNLIEVEFPEGLTIIGDRAFYNCKGLGALTIPSSVASIGDRAFNRCSGLTALTIPAGLKRIGSSAFDGCTNLVTIQLTRTTEYGANAFRNVPAQLPYIQ